MDVSYSPAKTDHAAQRGPYETLRTKRIGHLFARMFREIAYEDRKAKLLGTLRRSCDSSHHAAEG